MGNIVDLSFIIPAYNEEDRIANSLEKVINYLDKQHCDYEILLVDDGSKDKTVEISNSFFPKVRVISYGENRGKGAAVRYGMLNSTGKIRIFSDADLSTPVYELEKMLSKFKDTNCDIVIGNRADDVSLVKIHQPFYRELMGKTFNKLVQLFVFKGITDTQCGFKGFRDHVADKLFSKTLIPGFSFDVEILYLAKKMKYNIKQISVEWYNDERSKVSPIKDSLKMFRDILRIKKIHKHTDF